MLPAKLTSKGSDGFALGELLVVLLLAMGLVAAGLGYLRLASNQASVSNAVTVETGELTQFADAVKRFGDMQQKSATPGVRFDVSPATLIAAGLLSSSFAQRDGVSGTTALRQTYRATGIKDAVTGKVATAAWIDGDPRIDQVSYVTNGGWTVEDSDITSLHKQSIGALARQHASKTGLLPAGTTTATDLGNAWSINIAAWLPSAPSYSSPVVLQGFAVLDDGDPTVITDPPPPPKQDVISNCITVTPNGSSKTMCPSGYHEDGRWPYCSPWNPNFPQHQVYGSQMGDIVMGIAPTYQPHPFPECVYPPTPDYCGPYGTFTNVNDEYDYTEAKINGGTFNRDGACNTTVWGYCGTGPGTWICQRSYSDPRIAAYGTNGEDVLCCLN